MLDQELSQDARRMAIVYQSIHTFENMVRQFVQKALSEEFEAEWWSHVSEKIRNKVTTRMDEDAQFRWHGRRGGSEIMYCDFGDLSSYRHARRNAELEDIERIGMNIRDWVRQVG